MITCRYTSIKFDKHRYFLKCKVRLVVQGDQQAHLQESTYTATLAGRSFHALIIIAIRFDLELIQYNAINAFVNAKLDEEVYIKIPLAYRHTGTILKLERALYSLRKSLLLW